MRALIRKDDVKIEFTGRGQLWNELLRPWLGGPEAPAEAVPAPAPPPAQVQAAPAARPAPVALPTHRPSAPAAAAGPSPPRTVYVQPAPSAPRTWYPPKQTPPQQARTFERAASGPEEDEADDTVRVEPSSDPATLYARLTAIPGRRSEREAVLAAVWFVTKGERETTGDEVERHFGALHAFEDIKVVPHLLKHVHRTKMLELGTNPRAVRLTKKGVAHVQEELVGD